MIPMELNPADGLVLKTEAEDYGSLILIPGIEWNDMSDTVGNGNSWPIFEFEGVSSVKWYKQEVGGVKTQITDMASNSIVETPSVTTTYFYEITVNGVACEDKHHHHR